MELTILMTTHGVLANNGADVQMTLHTYDTSMSTFHNGAYLRACWEDQGKLITLDFESVLLEMF